jgi:hypothetical protein
MPRRPKPPVVLYGAPNRKRRHLCPHCLGYTRAVKGQKLEEAIAIHELTCPAIHRINPPKKGR